MDRDEANLVATALKKESVMGKTIVASVGTTETNVLSKFDRLIVVNKE